LKHEYAHYTEEYQAVNKKYVDIVASAFGSRYYMTDTDSGISDYKLCAVDVPGGAEVYLEKSGLTDDMYIGGWISGENETPQVLRRGIYNWYIKAEKITGTKTLRFYWKLIERRSDNSEVVIATSSESNEVGSEKSAYNPYLILQDDYAISEDSRVVGQIYARVEGSGNAPTVRVYYEGETGSHWEVPSASPGGAVAFVDLTDTPSAYSGQAGKVLAVKSTEDGIEFVSQVPDSDKLDGHDASYFATASHNHDDRYYTETELNTSGGGGAVHWDNITNKPSTYTPSSHNHVKADITDFAHTHPGSDITSQVSDSDKLDGYHASEFALVSHNHDDRYYTESELNTSGGGGQVHWNNVTNKPSTYTPSSHSHPRSEISDFWDSPFWGNIPDKPSTFPPEAHTHTKSEITDFSHNHDERYYTESELNTSGGGGAVHWDNITNKPSTYTPASHTHPGSDITSQVGDADTVDGQHASAFAAASHTHPGSDITSQVPDSDKLDGHDASYFATASHNHDDRYYTETELNTDGGGGAVHWNNITNKPSTYTPSSHNHVKADITDFAHTHPGSDITSQVGDADTVDGKHASEFALVSHNHDDRYYTESELKNSGGGGEVHWDNITNKPSIGGSSFTYSVANISFSYNSWNTVTVSGAKLVLVTVKFGTTNDINKGAIVKFRKYGSSADYECRAEGISRFATTLLVPCDSSGRFQVFYLKEEVKNVN